MTRSTLERFEEAMAGTAWSVTGGRLVVDGFDPDAEATLAALGGGSALLVNLSVAVRAAVAGIPILECGDVVPAMREAAAWTDRTSGVLGEEVEPLTLWLLCGTRLPERIVTQVARHPNTPGDGLARLLRFWTQSRPGSGGGLSEQMVIGSKVTEAVAGNPNTPPAVLAGLSRSGGPGVVRIVASNPATPLRELRRMQLGTDPAVRRVAAATIEQLAAHHRAG